MTIDKENSETAIDRKRAEATIRRKRAEATIRRMGLNAAVESGRSLTPESDGDEDSCFAAWLLESEAEKTRVEHFRRLAPQIREILKSRDAQKKRLAPADLWERRRQLVARRREEAHKLAASSRSMSAREMMAFRRDTRQQCLDLLNVDRDRLTRLGEEHARDLRRLVHGSADDLPMVEVLRKEEVPPEILNRTHNPPFTTQSPFPWLWHTFFNWKRGGKCYVRYYFPHGQNDGNIGHEIEYLNLAYQNGSGDNDYCNTEAKSLMGFNVPAQGSQKRWKFIIELQPFWWNGGIMRWTDDMGSSYADVTMYSNLRIAISTEPPTNLLSHPFERACIWKQWLHGDDDLDYQFYYYKNGDPIFLTWTTPFTLPNKAAFVSVGVMDYTDHYLDDVSVENTMENLWTIQQVSIQLV